MAAEVARHLGAELDVILVRKIGAPHNPELAAGAVSEDGEIVVEESVSALYGLTMEYIEDRARAELEVIRRRAEMYRGGRGLPEMRGKTVITVDDGIATGVTMLAAVKTVSKSSAERVVVAAPVAPAEVVARLERVADLVVVLLTPEEFFAIGEFYRDFSQVSDEEVVEILKATRGWLRRSLGTHS